MVRPPASLTRFFLWGLAVCFVALMFPVAWWINSRKPAME